ncbi:MAG: tRNA pseudouridine(13) synthase TruD [Patescibacteria group bacterium]
MGDEKLFDLFQREQEYLKEQEQKNPELFIRTESVESAETLAKVGISFPFSQLPIGYLKYHPFDFIVEEIQTDGRISSVGIAEENSSGLSAEDPTIYADLVKVGISTIDAVDELAKMLSIDSKNIGTAGIKDQNALTSQRISIRSARLDKVINLKPKNFLLQNLATGKGAIQLGSLTGNRFTIFVRTEKQIPQSAVEDQLSRARSAGFWNFYWLQRFGNRLLSHYWGLLLFRGDYQGAVRSYFCQPGNQDNPFYRQLRQQAAERFGDWPALREMFEKLPYSLRYELTMLDHLIKRPDDYTGALNTISDQIRLWVYAYASYLFNGLLSHYANSGEKCPKNLPLVLSLDRADQAPYQAFLEADGVPANFGKNLRPFPYIRLSHRVVNSQFEPEILGVKSLPEGVLIAFNLDKGSYATTFLAHLFTLTGGLPVPHWLKPQKYDFKKLLGPGSIKNTFEMFKDYIVEKEKAV